MTQAVKETKVKSLASRMSLSKQLRNFYWGIVRFDIRVDEVIGLC